MHDKDLKLTLDHLVDKYNCTNFITNDPISIPHQFTIKEDVEIAGFLMATIAWGNRKAILKSGTQLMAWMDNSPWDFIQNATEKELDIFANFKYRTFNGTDCIFFLKSLQNIYKNHNGLEAVFTEGYLKDKTIKNAISYFRTIFFEPAHESRTEKHIANTNKNSAAKRINMFLRWMIRKDNSGVDFGIWNSIPTKGLMVPLDVHSGTIAREFGLLHRKQNDWKALEELMKELRKFDANDPVKYDFALFGLGVNR